MKIHECACKYGGILAMPSNHFTRRTGGDDVNMHTYASFRRWLNVTFRTHQFKVLIYGLPVEFRSAFDTPAQVSQLQLAEAPYARRYNGLTNALGER